jgi:hypothetical protein
MARAGLIVGAVVLVAGAGYAARPDTGPRYLGDMPSIIEQAESAPPPAPEFVPPPPAPAPPHVAGPGPVVLASPPPIPPVAGERSPAPVTDAPNDFDPSLSNNGTSPPKPVLDLSALLPDGVLPCVGDAATILKPGQGLFDCVTGELLQVDDPGLCEASLPPVLQLGCPPD